MRVRTLAAITLAALIVQAPAAATGLKSSASTTLLAAGDIAVCSSQGSILTSRLLARLPGTIAALGDEAYPTGSTSDYSRCYKPTWGQFKARTRPTPGNHEYKLGNADAYFKFFGSKAAPPGGYYSYELGSWHIVVLNSNCKFIGGCDAGSPELTWLQADLAAHPAHCTLAYWHHARFSEGPDTTYDPASALAMQPVWAVLANAGADVVITAHDHMYERFAPLSSTGQPDPTQGMREFVAGTGGGPYYRVIKHVAGIQKVITFHWGVLRMKLSANGYGWQFLSAPSGSTLDSGSGSCH